jgi:formate hydrogenlyase transcriptional activator
MDEQTIPARNMTPKALGPETPLLARQEALFRVSRAINVYRDPAELFRVLAAELRQVVDFDFVALFLYNEVANKLRTAVLETLEEPVFVIPSDFPTEETMTWWVYHHQEPVLISSRDEESRFPRMMELFRHFGVQSGCILPFTTAYRRLGSLAFGARRTGAYSPEDVRYLSLVADQVALAVDNALRDEEQRRAELFLEEGQKLSHTGSWMWDLASGELKWSEEHFRMPCKWCGTNYESFPAMSGCCFCNRALKNILKIASCRRRAGTV